MRRRPVAVATIISVIGVAAAASYFALWPKHSRSRSAAISRSQVATVTPAPTRPADPPTLRFTTVAFAGALDADISGINNSGAYTGDVIIPGQGSRPFVVGRPGAKQLFFQLPFASSDAQTAGIDSAGGVAGTYSDPNGVFHGFIRTAAGQYRRLDVAGAGTARGEGTEIAGLSPGGVIVGSVVTASKVAVGFIDDDGLVTRYTDRSAGSEAGEGTAVEFYSALSGYGGVYIDADRSAHGWYVTNGTRHVVNDPAAGPPGPHKGTQLVGIDGQGRLYGVESPAVGVTRAFSMSGGAARGIRDPEQYPGPAAQTLVLGVDTAGDIVGTYTYDALGHTRAFIARPVRTVGSRRSLQ